MRASASNRRAWAAGPVALLALIALASAAPPVGATTQASGVATTGGKVVVFSVPRLTWADVQRARPPVLLELLERAAVGSMSLRTIGPHTSLGEGYATIGAGNRATVDDLTAGLALAPDEPFEAATAGDAFARRTATRPRGAVLHVAVPSVAYQNDRLLYGAEPGALADGLAAAGHRMAVVGNADLSVHPGPFDLHREVALAGMDGAGRVAGGRVDGGLLREDRRAPFGVRLDPGAAAAAFDRAWSSSAVVVVEASDLERADAYAGYATRRAGAIARRQAVESADRLLAHVLEQVDLGRDLVLVISPAAPRSREQLGIAAVAGPGFSGGWLRSATTRRDRYVTLPDVAPTVLSALGADAPDSVTGGLMRRGRDRSDVGSALATMRSDSERAGFRDRATGPMSVAFIVFQVLVYALAVVALRWAPRLRAPVAFCALVTLAVPTVAFLSGLVRYDRLGVPAYVVAVFAVAGVLAGVARLAGGRHPVLPPLLLIAGVLVLLLADAALGGPRQLNTVFGYSPVVAGRFAGYGNLASALLATAAIIVASGLRSLCPPSRWVVGAAAVLLVVVIGFIGSPALGSDVGGVLATVPAFAVVVLLLAGVRVGWRTVALVAAATLVVLAAFAAVDLSRPEADQTHLARLVRRVTDSDPGGGATTVLRRKVAANLSILTSSVWTYLIPAALGFLAFLVWRPRGFLQELQRGVPGLRACLVGALVAGLLGFSLNDSGVAVPAMMFAVLLPYLTYLLAAPSSPLADATAAPGEGTPAGPRSAAGTRS